MNRKETLETRLRIIEEGYGSILSQSIGDPEKRKAAHGLFIPWITELREQVEGMEVPDAE